MLQPSLLLPYSDDALDMFCHCSLRLLVTQVFMIVGLNLGQAGGVNRYVMLR